ncbi:hypothetical protein AT15_08900 [Kosmotoga arenicorallina S304]|uniref:Uncharacterized protein n=1 Tax=Kosmotoga arenicorallina S304 TaxID=1453497 RepID=A0A176K239_9BACT|nr:hypothetical protein AT15_08900 [Kosmotoga arenicorallina S304]
MTNSCLKINTMELLQLIKWRLKEQLHSIMKYRTRGLIILFLIAGVLFLVLFPLIFYLKIFFIPNFEKVSELSQKLKSLTDVDLSELIISFFASIIFVIMLGSDIPVTISNLFFADKLENLWHTPIKRSNIFKAQLFEVFSSASLPLVLFSPFFLGALYGLGYRGYDFLRVLFLFSLFIIEIFFVNVLASTIIVFFTSGKLMKFISAIMTAVTLVVFVFTLRIMDFSALESASALEVTDRLLAFSSIATSKFLPWSLFVKAITGDLTDALVFSIFVISLGAGVELVSRKYYSLILNKLWAMPRKSKNNIEKLHYLPPFLSLLKKDALLIFREPKLIFAFLYPALFAPVIIIANPSLIMGTGIIQLLSLFVFLLSNYTTIASTALFAFERQLNDFKKVFSVTSFRFVFSKVLLIWLLFSTINTMLSIYIKSVKPDISHFMTLFQFFMLPSIFVLAVFGGILEQRFGTGESKNVFKALNLTGAILSFLVSSIMPLLTALPVTLFILGRIDTMLVLIRIPGNPLTRLLFGAVIPVILWTLNLWLGVKLLCYNDV